MLIISPSGSTILLCCGNMCVCVCCVGSSSPLQHVAKSDPVACLYRGRCIVAHGCRRGFSECPWQSRPDEVGQGHMHTHMIEIICTMYVHREHVTTQPPHNRTQHHHPSSDVQHLQHLVCNTIDMIIEPSLLCQDSSYTLYHSPTHVDCATCRCVDFLY